MTNVEFVNMALKTAGMKTLYVKGGFGQVLTESRKRLLLTSMIIIRKEPR